MAEVKAKIQPEVQKWITMIRAYDRQFKRWEERADKIGRIYRDYDQQSDNRSNKTRFNILWSNVQTCLPATFSRLPKPDVSRRFRDLDPIGRVAAMILERGLEFEIDHYPDYKAAMTGSVLDRFLGGRGTAWVRYEPHFMAAQEGLPQDGLQVTDDANAEELPEAEPQEVIDYECAPVDYVHWRDFGHKIARTWEEVPTVWRKVYMERPGLVERFGEEKGAKIPLDTKPEELKRTSTDETYQACIYEIWDKPTKKAYWLSITMGEILDERDDPLELENFFPCPRPLYATTTTDSLIPVPDYKLYQDQARELDTLADRISGLIDMLKVRGVHDNSIPELARLFKEGGNGDLIAVKNIAAFADKGGLKGTIDIFDITPIVNALNEAYEAVDHVKNQIYEIMGIADIIRGSSDPNETATAVKTKGAFGSMRLRAMQGEVGRYATEILQIKAQIMCRWFQPETLAQIAGVQLLSQDDQAAAGDALAMLKNTNLRDFRIEVSADSLVQMDEQQEKTDRMEFLTAVGGFFQKAAQAAEQAPQLAGVMGTLLKFGVTGFKVGKAVEGELDHAIDQLKQVAANPQPKPDPNAIKAQAAAQLQQQKAQDDAAEQQRQFGLDQMRAQMEERTEKLRVQNEAALETHRQQTQAAQVAQQNQLEAQRAAMDQRHEQTIELMRQQHEQAMEASRQTLQELIARLNNATKVEVAEVAAGASIQRGQIGAANSAAKDDSIEGVDAPPAEPHPHVVLATAMNAMTQALSNQNRPRTASIKKNPDGSFTKTEE